MSDRRQLVVSTRARLLALDNLLHQTMLIDVNDAIVIIDGFATVVAQGHDLDRAARQWAMTSIVAQNIFDLLKEGLQQSAMCSCY